MQTWNTIKAVSTNKLDQAAAILETLQTPASAGILDYIQNNQHAQLLDLALHIQSSADELEYQLDRLCRSKLISRRENVLGMYYTINESKLRKAQQVAHTLARFYQE